MDEALFARLAERLAADPTAGVVLASVLQAQGAVPRRRGSRMLITAANSEFSIGGGQLEARVLAVAREMLNGRTASRQLSIDLGGKADSLGVCGGRLLIGLRSWCGRADCERAERIAAQLQSGRSLLLSGAEQGGEASDQCELSPDPRLLIVGAGHCGQALSQAAAALNFEVWVHDSRAEQCAHSAFAGAARVDSSPAMLQQVGDSARPVYAVLLNRDYQADIAALAVLLPQAPHFIGMMGSRRRIQQVLSAPQLGAFGNLQGKLQAPIGLAIDAHTPEEIAISILAQLIAVRNAPATGKAASGL
ncbi:MAG: XdhC family protein [Xanthomonadales bacterium]|nr:XdhC family protein [Xanthomonadales bacterium]